MSAAFLKVAYKSGMVRAPNLNDPDSETLVLVVFWELMSTQRMKENIIPNSQSIITVDNPFILGPFTL